MHVSNIVEGGGGEGGGAENMQMNSRLAVRLARVKKSHKCEFVPRLLSIIVVLHISNKNVSPNFLFSKHFFFKSDFCTINSHFLNPISKKFCNFSLKFNMANRRHVFLALWPRKRRNKLNKQKTKFALTGNAQKVIQALAFRSREKIENSFFSKIFGIV